MELPSRGEWIGAVFLAKSASICILVWKEQDRQGSFSETFPKNNTVARVRGDLIICHNFQILWAQSTDSDLQQCSLGL